MVAKTLHGLEGILSQELEAMGAEKIKINKRAVVFYGDKKLLYKGNFFLRTALRILKPISKFNSKNENELYKNSQKSVIVYD